MDALLAFLLALILTFFFVRRYLKTLAAPRRGAQAAPPATPPSAAPATGCPRCGKKISGDSSFCPGCGAPMALWNVHRAAVRKGAFFQVGTNKSVYPTRNIVLALGFPSLLVDLHPFAPSSCLSGL